ncbi:lysophospholipid acyltransferase family protein [Alkalihalobacterium alkalinitrilicum]|uniref:lysophospholipid acyltransferase family protein n=1 Tax=Alkalihalobacterium alkalinitrilicum TaxID=427920 RepID=UPI0009949F94|nr:lysophospholipid acyltransferase family protein [Alkalihalobacterium alkalinitrilicum]
MNLYVFGRGLFRSFFSTTYRVETIGLENIPKDGPVLLCCNHIHYFDPPFLGSYVPRKVHYMAKAELFKVPVLGRLVAGVGAFPVKRGSGDKQALKLGLKILKDGEALGLFPEGTRSKDGTLGKGLAGAGFFALRTDAVVIPCAIIGTYKPFNKLKVIYGKPLEMESLRVAKASAGEVTDYIMKAIGDILHTHKSQ